MTSTFLNCGFKVGLKTTQIEKLINQYKLEYGVPPASFGELLEVLE
ncbi:hypothetical protein [Thermoplasma sp. Kam2015]|nr:hypothetical protein [Thermoplasma sp. Kam2015]